MKNTILATLFFALQSFASDQLANISIDVNGQVTRIETERLDISRNEAGMAVFSTGDLLSESGEPQIPWKALTVLLPSGTDLETVSCRVVAAEYKTLDGEWDVAPAPPILTRDQEGNEIEVWPVGKTIVEGRDTAIYSTNTLWPGEKALLAGTGRLRSWSLAEIAVPLVRYNPVTGELQQLIRAEIAVDCSVKKTVPQKGSTGSWNGQDRVEKLVINFSDAKEVETKDAESKAPRGSNGYVIITTQNIRDNSTKLADFVAHKQTKGFAVTVVDEDDIWGAETPVAGDASATKLREWLQANYVSMDLKYALIIGDPRVDQEYVPMKMYPCGDRNIPTDYFYAELTCDWDKDGDEIIGEKGRDATNGDEIERYFEVYVGRIPHYGVMANTDAILQKTIDYETATDTAWRRKVLISNMPLDSNTHGYDWGDQVKRDLLEPKAISSDRAYRDGYEHTVTDYNLVPPPEFPASAYPATVWSQGQYGLHVWSTHGSTKGARDIINSWDAANLDDNHPATVFQGSCRNAWPEEIDNLSYALLKQGAILTLGATRNSYYSPRQHEFSNTPTDCGMSYRYAKGISEGKSCGEALWGLKEEIRSWWNHNWTLFNPYGDPSVVVMPPAPAFTITPTDAFFSRMECAAESIASRRYTLKNNSDSSLSWTASKTESWFDLSATGGTIPAGGSATVHVSLNTETASLSMDTHKGLVTFTDTSNHITEERKVMLAVGPNDSLRGYWNLDETDGTTADDQSAFKNDGTLSGTEFAVSMAGKYGNAINLDGDDDHIKLSGIKLSANTVTFTAWVRQGTTQNDWAGIVFDRSSRASGLNIGANRELRYHWNGVQWSWNSGLTPPADTWTFVALVVEPSKATIYMNSGGGFQTAVHDATHAAATFPTTYIGWDPHDSKRHFEGTIDEVRIYNYSMSPTELQRVYEGGGAESPSPFDGEPAVESSVFRWSAGATATTHEVYIGTNQAAVASATKVSPEYKETTTDRFFRDTLADQTPYYWRIDTVTDSTTLPGSVWSFTTGTMQEPGKMISVNFEQNSNQDFSGGEMIGPLSSDSTYWNATSGASGSLADLIDNIGTATGIDIEWDSSTLWSNTDGMGDDEHRLSVGYLDDDNSGSGKGATVTINNIPYTAYKVYGLFASDGSNFGSAMQGLDFNVNGTWAYGGSASSTTTVYGNIDLNQADHGEYWTETNPGTVIGNYWTMVTTGTTCTITGRIKSGSARGSLTGVIIEKLQDTDGDGIPNDTDPDDDNDGIPDDWETARGLDPLIDDASGHSDSDPYDNWFEYMTDTDPLDGNSWQTFSIGIDPGTHNPFARFNTSINRFYTVEFRNDLTSGSWVNLGSGFPGNGSETTVSDPAAGDQRFYRLQIKLP